MTKSYDLLVKGGVVVDPAQGLHEPYDLAIARGVIADVAHAIDAETARQTIDATGLLVTPGLIDLHVHVYPGVSHYGVDADRHVLPHGVTTVLDAGSSGADTFEGFRRYVVNVSATRIYALLNISSMGMISPQVGELEDLRFANVERAIEVIERNRDIIQGVKVRLSRGIVGENGLQPLLLAKRVSEAVGMPIMVHPGNTPMPLTAILAELRNRDVLTHCFHGSRYGILDDAGVVLEEVRSAVKRGVVLDVGHGRGSFSFDVAARALAQGVVPDTISSDLHHYNVFGPVHSLATTVSKFLYLGEHLGTLRPGSIADVAVFAATPGAFPLEDTKGQVVTGRTLLEPAAVVKDGRVHSGRLTVKGRR
jgi:dihydroorotase